MATRFLDETLAPGALREGTTVELGGSEAHHAVAVSRIRAGESVTVGDGSGTVAEGVVERAERDRLVVRLGRVEVEPPPSVRIVLVQALAKGDRDELAVQAACEVGVDAVIPWQAERSVSRWAGPKADRGRERWRTIAREAAKQSLRARVPEVRALVDTAGLAALAPGARILVLHPEADRALGDLVLAERAGAASDSRDPSGSPDPAGAPDEILLVVGPEGGIAPGELDRLRSAGAHAVRLGASVLRTSTAGPVAVGLLQLALGRW